jgi:NADH-quinone oxidoreductase subunit C/D
METIFVDRKEILEKALFLRDKEKFDFMMDLCGVDYLGSERDRFEVVYHLFSSANNKRLRLKVKVPENNPEVQSISSVWKTANWFERECFDLFGIKFLGHPNLKRILLYEEFAGHPLRKDYPIDRRQSIPTPIDLRSNNETGFWINFGPSHPATHGTFRLMLKLDGENIEDAIPEIGYLHRCFEKEAEDHTYTQVIPYTDRLNYCSSLMNNVGYSMAVEKLVGIDIPERAKYIRVLISELSRIIDHLIAIGTNVVDMGGLTNYWYTFNVRELIYDWIEKICGARLTANYTRIGGVMRDIPADTFKYIPWVLKKLDRAVRDVTGLLVKNRIFLDRTRLIGAISAEDAISYGYTGPCLRAAGVAYDVRKAFPYYHYDEFDWDVPVGANGDTYDRIMVRFEEMRQSARIINQVLKKMPEGPIMTDDYKVALPSKASVYSTIEGLMNHFKLIMHGMTPPEGEVYSFTEAANGELGFYIVSDGGPKPYRIKVRPPCFAIYQAYPDLIKGHMIADAVAIMGSLNVIAGELDR